MPRRKKKQIRQQTTSTQPAKKKHVGNGAVGTNVTIKSDGVSPKTQKIEPIEEKTSADYYFDSYSHFGIHEEMLKDQVRTKTYMRAIMNNAHLFRGKTVLDIGCGTGILCMFAAKAGAKKVIGVECAGIITQARQIIEANGFDDVVTLIKGKVEEVTLPVKEVDIIVSEWMGYFLLYESMLDTVIFARDKWLKKGGTIFPDKATLYIAALEDRRYRENKINFWESVYGFDMSCIKELALVEPLVDVCPPHQVISDTCSIFDIDLYTITKEELDFTSKFELRFSRDDYCHAFVAYFTVDFSKSHTKIRFSTGPRCTYTHWKQTVFYIDTPLTVCRSEILKGEISVKRNEKNPRDLDIFINSSVAGKYGTIKNSRNYRLR